MTYTVFRNDTSAPIAAVVCAPGDLDAVKPHVPDGAVVVTDKYCPLGFSWAFTQDEWERINKVEAA